MFIQKRLTVELFMEYSLQIIHLFIDKNMEHDLPISTNKNNSKCLDFDMESAVFISLPRSTIKLAQINPSNKTWLEVMDMV
jgi:hypothetical protein